MHKDRKNKNSDSMMQNEESSRRSGSGGYGSSTGRSGSIGNMGGGSDVSRDDMNEKSDSSMDTGRTGSSWGRH